MLLNPVGYVAASEASVAPRVNDLNGKAVGFLFNGHWATPVLFQAVRESLIERFRLSGVVDKLKPKVGAASPAEHIDDVASRCDLAVLGVGA
ncbi:MAG: hypothetical protein HYX92_05675 [Chloroflexi bacterium]|nr:hypothetical protein [Chloroflexota bacterium]